MTVTVPCTPCCQGGGGGGPGGCPSGANCRVKPDGPDGEPDTQGCVTHANYNLSFVSFTGSGCLVGYSEFLFGPPSDPPVKYLTKTFTGMLGIEGTCGGIGCAGCNENYSIATYTGSNNYSPTTGILVQGSNGRVETNGAGCGPGTITFNGPIENITDAGVNAGSDGASCQEIVSKTSIIGKVLDQFCTPGTEGCFNTHSACGGYYTLRYGSATETLSTPDTPQNALMRSGAIEGSESSAILSAFVGFCFTGQTSHWTANFSGLNPVCNYRFTVTYTRDDGAGGTTTITDETTFSPDGPTYVLEGDIPAVVDLNTWFSGSVLEFLP